MTAALEGLGLPRPSEKALRDLRRRLGPAPAKAVFEMVAVPLAHRGRRGVPGRGLRTVAFDGLNSVKVPDTSRNRSWLGKIRNRLGVAGYPTLRMMALAETGTRGLLGAAIGSAGRTGRGAAGPAAAAPAGAGHARLLDRAFDANAFLGEVAATGALLLARAKSTRRPPVLGHLPDGSYLSHLDGLAVRVIEASVTMTGADGSRVRDGYRLITTLMDHRRFPAAAVVRLYHERWEIESAYFALRHTLLNGHVLRSGDRPGLEQETWALLTLYQLLRMAMVDAVETRPGTDPDRASFTTAMEAAKDQLTAAAGICPDGPADLPGAIGRPSWPRCCPPAAPGTAPARSNAPPPGTSTATTAARPIPPPSPRSTSPSAPRPSTWPGRTHRDRSTPRPPRPPGPATRRERITAIITSHPPRDWSGHELAVLLHVKPRNMLTQLGEWARLGFFTRTGSGTYKLNTPPADPPWTIPPDP